MRYRRFILCTLVLLASFTFGRAEVAMLLQQLNEARQQTKVPVQLHEEHNAQGELTHLGVALFNEDHQEVLNPYLWRGVERMMLELVLKANDAERQTWLRERNTRLFLNATTFGSQGFTAFSKALPILNNVSSIKINEEAGRYKLLVTGSDDNTLRLSFPKERELIFGTDKKEEDERQSARLMSFKGSPTPSYLPSTDDLILTSTPGVYHTVGQALYIDSLRTDGYYKVTDNVVSAVYEAAHPKESVCNLLLGKLRRKEFTVHVIHRQYGNKVTEWTTTLDNLLAALSNEEVTEPFAAAQYTASTRQLTGILVLRNTAFGFNNMMLVSIPQDQLDSDAPCALEAMIYTNIPQHNILSLFEERVHKRSGDSKPNVVYDVKSK